jgi:hypothetical protein
MMKAAAGYIRGQPLHRVLDDGALVVFKQGVAVHLEARMWEVCSMGEARMGA